MDVALSRLAEQPDEPREHWPRLTADSLHAALVEAGVIRSGEAIRRIVIDAKAGSIVVIHLERWGDARLLDVVRTLDGVEIRERPGPPAATPD